jgi:hypothetical protein
MARKRSITSSAWKRAPLSAYDKLHKPGGELYKVSAERYIPARVKRVTANTPSISKREFQEGGLRQWGVARTLEERAQKIKSGIIERLSPSKTREFKTRFSHHSLPEIRKFLELQRRKESGTDKRGKGAQWLSKPYYVWREKFRNVYKNDPTFERDYPRPPDESPKFTKENRRRLHPNAGRSDERPRFERQARGRKAA